MQTPISEAVGLQPTRKRRIMPTYDRHIVVTPGVRGGKARIIGRRITVADIAVWCLQQHRAVDDLVQEYDLTHAQVHAALTYYYDHQAEIEEREKVDQAAAESLREIYPSRLQTK